MVADTATNLIERPVSGFCAVLYACTAFILLTTTSSVAPRVASFTTCTWNNKMGFLTVDLNPFKAKEICQYDVSKMRRCISV